MKRSSVEKTQNIIYTAVVMLVAAGLVVYSVYRKERAARTPLARSFSASVPAPVATAEPVKVRSTFQSAPTDVLLIQLETNDALLVTETEREDAYTLRAGAEGSPALLRIAEKGDRVASMTLEFTFPADPGDAPQNSIEEAIAERLEQVLAKRREEVRTVLCAVLQGADLNDVLQEPVLRTWYEAAMGTLDTGKSYKNTYKSCLFTAARTEADDGTWTLTLGVVFPV